MSKQIVVRVLVDTRIGDFECKSGELVSGEPSLLKPYLADRSVDKTKAGIDYAKSIGVEVKHL